MARLRSFHAISEFYAWVRVSCTITTGCRLLLNGLVFVNPEKNWAPDHMIFFERLTNLLVVPVSDRWSDGCKHCDTHDIAQTLAIVPGFCAIVLLQGLGCPLTRVAPFHDRHANCLDTVITTRAATEIFSQLLARIWRYAGYLVFPACPAQVPSGLVLCSTTTAQRRACSCRCQPCHASFGGQRVHWDLFRAA